MDLYELANGTNKEVLTEAKRVGLSAKIAMQYFVEALVKREDVEYARIRTLTIIQAYEDSQSLSVDR